MNKMAMVCSYASTQKISIAIQVFFKKKINIEKHLNHVLKPCLEKNTLNTGVKFFPLTLNTTCTSEQN